jgi:hypothetical protein
MVMMYVNVMNGISKRNGLSVEYLHIHTRNINQMKKMKLCIKKKKSILFMLHYNIYVYIYFSLSSAFIRLQFPSPSPRLSRNSEVYRIRHHHGRPQGRNYHRNGKNLTTAYYMVAPRHE